VKCGKPKPKPLEMEMVKRSDLVKRTDRFVAALSGSALLGGSMEGGKSRGEHHQTGRYGGADGCGRESVCGWHEMDGHWLGGGGMSGSPFGVGWPIVWPIKGMPPCSLVLRRPFCAVANNCNAPASPC